MTIKYFSRNVYGLTKNYMVDSKESLAVGELTGAKTLNSSDMEALKDLGITLEQVLDPLTVKD